MEYHSIGVFIGTPGLGDFLISVPFFNSIKQSFPKAKIFFIGQIRDYTKPIFHHLLPSVEIIEYQHINGFKDLVKNIINVNAIRELNLDLLIDTQRAFIHSLLIIFSGAKIKISASAKGIFSSIRFPDPKKKYPHILDQLLYYATVAGAKEISKELNFNLNPLWCEESKRFLDNFKGDYKKFIGIAPMSARGIKGTKWQKEYYAELIDLLEANLGAKSFLLGSELELYYLKEIQKMCRYKPTIPMEENEKLKDILYISAFISKLDLVVANDNGLAHLSSAVGTLPIIIYGPTRPERFSPIGRAGYLPITKNFNCSPCRIYDTCPHRNCLAEIKPKDVFREIEKICC